MYVRGVGAAAGPYQAVVELTLTDEPLLRDPHAIRDLLGYQLISGAITGWD